MDADRFEALTRELAAPSRRGVLRLLLAASVAAAGLRPPAPVGASSCQSADDCDDGNPCTDDSCDMQTGYCVNTLRAGAACGEDACTTGKTCDGAGVCGGGTPRADGTTCTAPGDLVGACSAGTCCPSGTTSCGGACVDLRSDEQRCGSCDATPCPGDSVCAACKGSSCSGVPPARCCPTAKRTNCNGRCVNVKTDEKNCGRCGKKCKSNQRCRKGDCVAA